MRDNDSGVKNLDDIQEDDPSARPSRSGALVLASLGGACIVLAAALLFRAPAKAKPTATDPLGDLVARAHPAGSEPARSPEPSGIRESTLLVVLASLVQNSVNSDFSSMRLPLLSPAKCDVISRREGL